VDAHGYQTDYHALCAALRKFVMREVTSHGAGRARSLEHRAMITLYSLLLDHPIDQWGHCQSCRRPGSMFGARWRPCQVYNKAVLCLERLDEVILLDLLSRTAPPTRSARERGGVVPGGFRGTASDEN
jgi:hypothetical protein